MASQFHMDKPPQGGSVSAPKTDEIGTYLSNHPWTRVKDIAKDLNCSRKELNSVLYSEPDKFEKNKSYEWSVKSQADAVSSCMQFQPTLRPASIGTIHVEKLDLIERIKELLKQDSALKARDIASRLAESRVTINRALHSFRNVFEKEDNNTWAISSDYIDDTTGPDATFADLELENQADTNFPVPDFEEKNAPQQLVIEARIDKSFLVLAPPGTGKTHTLIERLIYAICKAPRKIDAGELLVLSFTRAAVSEINARITKAISDGAPTSLRYVQVRTFDAYATWLLNDGSYDTSGKNYDARIKLLTAELAKLTLRQATSRIDRSRYLFVDEVQDLVGVRADMVFELVKRILANQGSVTLLGDPHQSLNNYQVTGNQTNSTEFLENIRGYLAGGLESIELAKYYRYETPLMKSLAANAKRILDANGITAEDKFDQLLKLIPKITQEQLMKHCADDSIDALLCRSNAEVFQWSNWHERRGNSCAINAGAIGLPWPSWIGQAITGYQRKIMTRIELLSRVSGVLDGGVSVTEQELDRLLLCEGLLKRNEINLGDLAFKLKNSPSAKKIDRAKGDRIKGFVISTVHKAKGLGYKNVVVVEPKIYKAKGVTDEDVRVLYVAITRAKCSITLLPKTETPFRGWMTRKKGGHLGYADEGIKYLQVKGLEDFDLDSLFIDQQGGIDTTSLENYLLTCLDETRYVIRPESCNQDNDHNYALFLITSRGTIRLCLVSKDMKKTLDAMSWGNKYGADGAMLEVVHNGTNQTIVHPMESPLLARYIGPAGIMVFPALQGFFPLSKATGE
jgi:superfamily I DNA/RNA helicase